MLLKLSGEILGGEAANGVDYSTIQRVCEEIAEASELAQLALVIGGGNFFRGSDAHAHGVDRVTADYAGMLATVLNGLILQSYLERLGVQTRLMTAFEMRAVAEPYIRRRAIRHLEKGRVVLITGGTGRPLVSTDTAAVLFAVEIQADALFKATTVDGVYDQDPEKHPNAQILKRLSYQEALHRDLRFMDPAALSLARENLLPLVIFNAREAGNLLRLLRGESIGSWVGSMP